MSKKKEISGLVTGLVAIVAAACFIILGFTTRSWHIVWIVFLAIPITAITMDIAMKNKDISGLIIGLVAILVAAVYIVLGFVLRLWHPGWVVFLAIPLTSIIFDIVKKKDMSGAITGGVAILAVAIFIILGTFLHIWYIAWVVFLLIPITAIITNIVKLSKKEENEEKP